MEKTLRNLDFKSSDIDDGTALCEAECAKHAEPGNAEQISPAGAFATGTWERRMLVDVLARMSKVVLESQRDPNSEPTETLLDTRDNKPTPVLASPPTLLAEGFQRN